MNRNAVFIVVTFFLSAVLANENLSQEFLEGNKQFSAEIYKQLLAQKQNENFLVCPFSAETIIALTINGAKDETLKELQKALHFPNSTEETNSIFKNLVTDMKKGQDYKLNTANKIYVKENYTINNNFKHVASKIYKSGVQNVNFVKRRKAAKIINKWVEKQTQNRIKNFISPESLDEETAAILINALYFQGAWRKNFKATLTRPRDFYKTPHEVIQVQTMRKTDHLGYYENEKAKFLQMPFHNTRKVSMVLVLPHKNGGLAELEDEIDEVYKISDFKWEFVELTLPKFKIESNIDFKTILKNLGVNKAFGDADFSGLAGKKGDIYITDVLQKTFISVNENGVEAAAATAVLFGPKSLMEGFGEKKFFIVDHPFLFYIKINDVIVFTGRVVLPQI